MEAEESLHTNRPSFSLFFFFFVTHYTGLSEPRPLCASHFNLGANAAMLSTQFDIFGKLSLHRRQSEKVLRFRGFLAEVGERVFQ